MVSVFKDTNQVHSMLEHAIEELEFLRKQEERALQIQIKQIHEVKLSSSVLPLHLWSHTNGTFRALRFDWRSLSSST